MVCFVHMHMEVVKKTVNRMTAAKDKYGCKLKKINIANIYIYNKKSTQFCCEMTITIILYYGHIL